MLILVSTIIAVPPSSLEIVDHANGSVVEALYTEPTVSLVCRAANGRPAATMKWFRDDKEITSGIQSTVIPVDGSKLETAQSTLTINPKFPEDNNVQFTCQAYNNALTNGPLRSVVTLRVLCKYIGSVSYKHHFNVKGIVTASVLDYSI